MGELKRQEEELTTADLVNRAGTQDRAAREEISREEMPAEARQEQERAMPMLVKNEVPTAATNAPSQNRSGATHLFSESDVNELRAHWIDVQTGFVDEPRNAVEKADKLVATVMQRLAEGFANERSTLEQQWAQGANVSTEDLRVALQRYRSFFDRLLSA
jgi:hypothetical protein